MHRRLQFGMRENPASDRRHGSRQEVRSLLDAGLTEQRTELSLPLARGADHPFADASSEPNAASPLAATGGKRDGTDTHCAGTASPASRATMQRSFEPLISSCEAARLLGNIHVKTLQRYARHRNIPGYQIGGHWYFRASELDSWLRSRLNLSCHPCRLPKEAK